MKGFVEISLLQIEHGTPGTQLHDYPRRKISAATTPTPKMQHNYKLWQAVDTGGSTLSKPVFSRGLFAKKLVHEFRSQLQFCTAAMISEIDFICQWCYCY